MILVVNLNPALDLTYEVPALHRGRTNRVVRMWTRAGGKGINVARVLQQLGVPVTVLALLGGTTGEIIRKELAEAGVKGRWLEVPGETRRCIAVHDQASGEVTEINEPGPDIDAAHWRALQVEFTRKLVERDLRCVVLSGSLPPGLPVDAYSTLVTASHQAKIPVILDTSGEALRRALRAGPTVIKPNRDELAGLIGADPQDMAETALEPEVFKKIRGLGPAATVVSLGRDGLVAVTPQGAWHAVPPGIEGNPTGAGDAAVAALARGMVENTPWPELLRQAAALSAAAVAEPVAGRVDLRFYEVLLPKVSVEELEGEESR